MTAKPNIILVLTDDQGYGDLGCHGNPHIQTPCIDRFYEESVRFTDFHVGPTCAPTRSGLVTGHYANSTGVWHTVGGRSLLRGNETTLAHVYRENGYRTGLFGKWHLGDSYPYRPQDRGFETVVTHGGGGVSQMPDWWGNDYFDDTYMTENGPVEYSGFCTDVWFREAVKYIEQCGSAPFVCFITTNAPHSPYNVEKKYSDLYTGTVTDQKRRNFYGMITNIDENFGMLDKKLTELGIADDTILIFMTDNGTSCGGEQMHTAGLRGAKGSPYDGGHRVPFFMRWPNGGFKTGRDIDRITSFVDFMPTLMDLAGIDPEIYAQLGFHGTSLKPLIQDGNCPWPERTVFTDSQRLVNPVKWRKSAVMTDTYRLINGKELYNMTQDRGQEHDISGSHPEVVDKLRAEYEAWWDLVSGRFDEEIPIPIGTEPEPEACLFAMDWRHPDNPRYTDPEMPEENDYLVWHQGQVRQGKGERGYFEITVESAGEYEFELRRWPPEEERPIVQGIEPSGQGWRSDVILEEYSGYYSGGTALPITGARVTVTRGSTVCAEASVPVEEGDVCARISCGLEKGPAHLACIFTGPDSFVKGAYYVRVRRLTSPE